MANGVLKAVRLYTTYGRHLDMFETFGTLHTPSFQSHFGWYWHDKFIAILENLLLFIRVQVGWLIEFQIYPMTHLG